MLLLRYYAADSWMTSISHRQSLKSLEKPKIPGADVKAWGTTRTLPQDKHVSNQRNLTATCERRKLGKMVTQENSFMTDANNFVFCLHS
jgi:hypothetical protein